MMFSVLITSDSRYPVNRPALRRKAEAVLGKIGVEDVEVSLLIAGERKMKKLFRDFLKKDEAGEVLAFPQDGPRAPDGILYLGDIVISYPAARKIAMEEEKMVGEVLEELVEHGINNLLF